MIDIFKQGSTPEATGPEDYFTGSVKINAPFKTTGACPRQWRDRLFSGWRTHGLAYASSWTDVDRDTRTGAGSGVG